MSTELRNLEPKEVWNQFADLNAVPRPSKQEERVRQFMKDFGASLNLEVVEDAIGNVIIKKPATPGMESRQTVVMQSHLDMVHQKNEDTQFDFQTEGIRMHVDGDWVKADGTTLGADNGMGVAAIMAVLSSTDLPHPAIEALFTIDEETGMTGAKELERGILQGTILLNLDTEEDDEIGIGCAGGIDITGTRLYDLVDMRPESTSIKVALKGLQGGHSGMDIIKGLGNANVLMGRILGSVMGADVQLHEFHGGNLRNAIPREASMTISTDTPDMIKQILEQVIADIKNEYKSLEPNLSITLGAGEKHEKAASPAETHRLVCTLRGLHNGVYRMSPDVEDLVETSNNIARVTMEDGSATIACLTRSSVESGKHDLADVLQSVFELGGFGVEMSGDYPGWEPNMASPILQTMMEGYKRNFGEEPHVAACHAGLECGILGERYPQLDMISFGPTIKGAHSPDERASISSVQKFWSFLKDTLAHIPE